MIRQLDDSGDLGLFDEECPALSTEKQVHRLRHDSDDRVVVHPPDMF